MSHYGALLHINDPCGDREAKQLVNSPRNRIQGGFYERYSGRTFGNSSGPLLIDCPAFSRSHSELSVTQSGEDFRAAFRLKTVSLPPSWSPRGSPSMRPSAFNFPAASSAVMLLSH